MKKARELLPAITIMALLAACTLLSGRIASAVALRLDFCVTVIVPQLFVSLVVSQLAGMTVNADNTLAILLIGACSGYPSGAVMARRLYDRGSIDRDGAARLCACSSGASLSFTVGYVGNILLGNLWSGVLIFVWQLTVLIIASRVMRIKVTPCSHSRKADLLSAVKQAALQMIEICGVIIVFSLPAELITRTFALPSLAKILICGASELSLGCYCAAGNGAALAAICGVGGFCAAMQVKSALGDEISMAPYLAVRGISGVVLGVLGFLFLTK